MTAERSAHRSYGMRLAELARERRTFVLTTGSDRLQRPIYRETLAAYDRAVLALMVECRALETRESVGRSAEDGRMI